MDLSRRRRLSKILWYRYFDLSQSSTFLNDKETLHYAKSMMTEVKKYIKSGLLFEITNNEILELGFPIRLVNDIEELKSTGNIEYILAYKSIIPFWLHPIISPSYLDLNKLRILLLENRIEDIQELRAYLENKSNFSDFEEMLYHSLTYMDDNIFPESYYKQDLSENQLANKVGDRIIHGTLHNHTIQSDGYSSLEDVISYGQKCRYEYIGISDHSYSTLLGISEEELSSQHSQIDKNNIDNKGIFVLKGIECEILRDGKLDYDCDQLKKFDYLIGGIHTDYNMTRKQAEKRIVKAIESGLVNILAHPSNRIYGSKPGFDLDFEYIIDACIRNNVVIEINGNKKRLDLDPKYITYASNHDAMFEIAADTHKLADFGRLNNAIAIVEDYKIPAEQIINLYNKSKLLTLLQKHH